MKGLTGIAGLRMGQVSDYEALTGCTVFGLEAASGVRRYLARQGIGFETRAAKIPIVPCAILEDLGMDGQRPPHPMRWAKQPQPQKP
jgi:L-aminopeptidase/D-esterase-like protein